MFRSLLVFPVLAGKTDDDAKLIAHQFRARPAEYEASRRRAGITLERAYLQKTPMGDRVVTYIESGLDFAATSQLLTTSDLAIDGFYTKAVKEVYGIDVGQSPVAETVATWVNPHVASRGKGLAFCAPLAPDSAAAARKLLAQEYTWKEFGQSRRARDQSVEVAGLLHTPEGPMGTFYLEGKDPTDAVRRFAQSTRPYDVRLRGLLAKVFLPVDDYSQALAGIDEIFDSTQVASLATSDAAAEDG